jgi:hypothetical protein
LQREDSGTCILNAVSTEYQSEGSLEGFSQAGTLNMRIEVLKRLLEALQSIEAIERFIENYTLDHYLDDELMQSEVERKFEIIEEALNRALDADPSVLELPGCC